MPKYTLTVDIPAPPEGFQVEPKLGKPKKGQRYWWPSSGQWVLAPSDGGYIYSSYILASPTPPKFSMEQLVSRLQGPPVRVRLRTGESARIFSYDDEYVYGVHDGDIESWNRFTGDWGLSGGGMSIADFAEGEEDSDTH